MNDNDTADEPHRAPAPLITDELIDVITHKVRSALAPATVNASADYATLTHTPKGASAPTFRACTQEIAAALADAIVAEGSRPPTVHLHFDGVPASGSVHCAVTVVDATIDSEALAAALGAHTVAALHDAGEGHVSFALYPPSTVGEPRSPYLQHDWV
jgi:hypothetical protein